MSFADTVKTNLSQIIHSLDPSDFSKNPGIDFSRKRKLDFYSLIELILSMETGSVRDELLKYFQYDPDTISNPGFLQQREKLSPDVFSFILKEFSLLYPYTLYKNKYQLLAVDGSAFTYTRCPEDTDSYFPPDGKTTKGYNQVHLVSVYDLPSKRFTDCIVQPIRKKNEFQAMYTLIDRHESPDGIVPVFIADRGFHALNVFAHAIENHAYFLIRATDVKTKRLLAADYPENEDTFDLSIQRILTRSASRKKRLQPDRADQYKLVCSNVTFDYITPDHTEYEIALRVIRLKVSDDGYENLITNLPENEFPLGEIKSLYHLRWGIETSFRELKHVIGAMNFHSKKRKYITLQLWARMLLYNFCSIITTSVVISRKKRKCTYQVNYTAAYKACIYFLRLRKSDSPPDIESLIRKNILPIRPDRIYARQHKFRNPVSFTYRFG